MQDSIISLWEEIWYKTTVLFNPATFYPFYVSSIYHFSITRSNSSDSVVLFVLVFILSLAAFDYLFGIFKLFFSYN
jgi:hypothetical protein